MAENDKLTGEALRTLGVASRLLARTEVQQNAFNEEVEQDLVFLGLTDPPREEAREAVARAKDAGIRPIMITGDHPQTAAVITSELSIAANARTVAGAEIETMSGVALDRTVREVSVYARVNPEHKRRIVRTLQREGMTVMMTGGGVNDAPAPEDCRHGARR